MDNQQDQNQPDNNIERQLKNTSSPNNDTPSPEVKSPKVSPVEMDTFINLVNFVRNCLTSTINKEDIDHNISQIVNSFIKNPYNDLLLYSYTSFKNNYLFEHIVSNIILSIGFGVSLQRPQNELMDIGVCALCHDFGMKEYADLFQKSSQLEKDETQAIQQHPHKSAELCKPFFSEKIINGILDIHEQVNGKGYPEGKTGDEISTIAKIVSICDIFSALTHPRKYRLGLNPYEAIKIIIKKKDIIFDSQFVKKFVEYLSIYPVGCLVYLNTGEKAIVVGSNRGYPTRSIVKILLTSKNAIDHSGKIINLLQDDMLYINGPIDPMDEAEILHFLKPRGDIRI